MPTFRFPLAAAMLAAMGSLATGGREANDLQEGTRVVARTDLPEAALKAITQAAGGLDFGPVTAQPTEAGTLYSADMVRDGHAAGIEVDGLGNLRSISTEVQAWELPPAVKRAADAETLGFPARTFTVRSGPTGTLYLVDAATGLRGKRLEIDASGRILNKELKLG